MYICCESRYACCHGKKKKGPDPECEEMYRKKKKKNVEIYCLCTSSSRKERYSHTIYTQVYLVTCVSFDVVVRILLFVCLSYKSVS